MPSNASRWRRSAAAVVLAAALALPGCSWFGNDDAPTVKGTATSVFDVQPGQCFNPPAQFESENSEIPQVPCDQPHTLEAYALVDYWHRAGVRRTPTRATPH